MELIVNIRLNYSVRSTYLRNNQSIVLQIYRSGESKQFVVTFLEL